MKHLATLATAATAAAAVLLGPSVIKAKERGENLEISRKNEQKTIEGPEEYFTGKATISGQFEREDPSRLTGAIVHFEPGARTAWHSHPLGQTLIVTEGVGWTQVEGEEKVEFYEGDILLCPKDKKHWHGATPTQAMTHIALQEALDGTNVTWMEKVTDEQYLGDGDEG
ncbi:cupin domain-containing protein [Erythrobacter sp. SCSIO 43205]|uniref:(R)-mandelonitrile lyase n=1 Tax=Erythrobacter sp. SCSIO 43205 TaxID=2779361 RepID=UPI00351D29F8